LVVSPVEVEHGAGVEWTQDVGPWFSQDSALQKYEIGLRSDGVMVWRPAVAAQDAAEALRQWREYEARKFEQHQIDAGAKWQSMYQPQGDNEQH
jgi:hypothetical protein